MPTYRLDLAYDGGPFRGYARQPTVPTVQGALEDALASLIGEVETAVAGRTDAGVHAAANVVSFDHPDALDTVVVARRLNRRLGPEIAVTAFAVAPDGFHARFSALARRYEYRILNREAPDPFVRHNTWHLRWPLDVGLMDSEASFLVGEHDFASFCKRAEGRSTIRRVDVASVVRTGDLVTLRLEASSFCHQMVRSVVAALVDVGRGKLQAGTTRQILDAGDRDAGRGAAPPHGLTLVGVGYD